MTGLPRKASGLLSALGGRIVSAALTLAFGKQEQIERRTEPYPIKPSPMQGETKRRGRT